MNKIVCLIICLLLAGCQTKTGSRAVSSSKIGSYAGEVFKNKECAAVGSDGTLSGGLIGPALDEQDKKIMENTSPRTLDRMDRGEPITISDIIKLSQGGVNDEIIIRYIHSAKTTYHLTQAQIRRLRQGGVSQRVIKYIFDNRS